MASREMIDRFLSKPHLAFVGVSRDPKEFSNVIYRRLRDGGRTMYPVNDHPDATTIEGDLCYHRLADVPDAIDGVIVMVHANKAVDVVREAIARGIPRVWLHKGFGPGAVSDAAIALCRQHGVEVVDGACPLMFDEPVGGAHRVHRFFARRRFPETVTVT